jgi:hypothetical protein
MSAKLVPKSADRGCYVASVTDPYCRILGFVDRIYTSINVIQIGRTVAIERKGGWTAKRRRPND